MGSYNYYKMFGCFNRKFKMKDNGPPPDVVEAFSLYTGDGSQMSGDQLLRFLVDFQGEVGSTLSMTEDLMNQVLQRRHHLTKYTRTNLTLDDFYYFLFQDDLNPPINSQVHHDMTAPLQHYFIYTGHNSYLTGNQLSSDCSDIPIINALERGVRGIELDLWPNSSKDKVHVLHGRTLTTPVRLDKCFKSIRQHAFVKSPYPVIVTLEDHLTPSLREKVAEMAIQIFGELLYYPEPGVFDVLPSPNSLKHQIVLSTKPPKEYLDSIKPPKEYLDSIKPSKESLELKNVKVMKNLLGTEKISGEDLSEKGTPENTDEAEFDQGNNSNQDGEDAVSDNTRGQKSNSDMDDEERGSDSHKSSKQLGQGFKRLYAIHSADLRVEPPNGRAEGSADTDLSSQLGKGDEHAGAPSIDSHLPSQLKEADEHAAPPSMNTHLSSRLRETDEHAGLASINNQNSIQLETLNENSKDPSLDNCNLNQFRPPDGLGKDPSSDNQKPVQVEESDECTGNRNVESSKTSPLGTPEYKRLLAFQSTDVKDAEDLDVSNNRSKTGTTEHKRLVSLLDAHNCYLNQFGPPDGLGKDPSSDNQKPVQVEESDECTENRNVESSKTSPLGTPEYKRLLAFQSTDVKDAEDLDVSNNRSKTGTTEHKRLVSLLDAHEWGDEDEDDEDEDVDKTKKTASVYKRLIAIHAEKPKDGLRKTFLAEADKVRRVSLSEQELAKAAESYGTDIVRFTQKNLVRVYPKGTRVTSSNFEPLTGWMVGAQMVAFNMQGYGKSLWLMHGMFRGNGGCGYVKKPEILMKKAPHEVFDYRTSLPEKKTLKVKVYMGDGWRLDFSHTHFDAYSPPDFYTKIYIVGAPADFAKTRTKIIEDDWTPNWNEEFVFPLKVPELALLRIEVREYDMSDRDDFGGQTCLPVSELRPGIRAVPLYDKKGGKYRSVRLLMRFQFV